MKIRVIDRDGNKHELEGDPNSTLMEILRDADLDIEINFFEGIDAQVGSNGAAPALWFTNRPKFGHPL